MIPVTGAPYSHRLKGSKALAWFGSKLLGPTTTHQHIVSLQQWQGRVTICCEFTTGLSESRRKRDAVTKLVWLERA
ncbi:hypothetical protein E2C01_024648 [Portunus trituberculatus]|uniref:Uncharacterized protein n=1 Tax=Portunus trituberculatus TaxID=210409 RepID=A0A5B7EB74_PORTR|nr:hypothetical protein [Portunus trituberculatus]